MKLIVPVLATVAVVSLISNVLIYQRFNTKKPVVTVGAQKISKFEYEAAMEKTSGLPTLKKIVYTALVRQAAAKAGVMPTEADVDRRLADMEAKSPQIAQQAAIPAFREDLKTDIALENLRIQGVTASDAEISAFYDRNKAIFAVPGQVQTTMVISQKAGDAKKAAQLLGQNVTPEAIATQPGLRVAGVNGVNVNMNTLPKDVAQNVGKTVLAMKEGQIATVPVPDPQNPQFFLTFKAKKTRSTDLPALPAIKDQVARAVRLQKAVGPQDELVVLYQHNPPVFNVPQYADYFKDIQEYAAQKKSPRVP